MPIVPLLTVAVTAAGLALATACSPPSRPGPTPEATSLFGQPLFPPALAEDARARMEADLEQARAAWLMEPDDADATVWLGRRLAYLGQYREAIKIFSSGLDRHPEDPRFYRHRGHRYITVREFRNAVADLARAAALIERRPDEVEPDGQPNARGIPTSTLHSNIWYHLGLARYLTGAFDEAAAAWTRARDAVDNPDNLVAASNWLYLSLRRAGRHDEAAAVLESIDAGLDVIENTSYHTLLLLYRGEGGRSAEEILAAAAAGASGAAVRYGVGAWMFVEGRTDEARAVWERMVADADWASFGHIAAEAELARSGGRY